jgi:hypothetical protein
MKHRKSCFFFCLSFSSLGHPFPDGHSHVIIQLIIPQLMMSALEVLSLHFKVLFPRVIP